MTDSRLDRLRTAIRDGGLDVALITDPVNRRYLTGHTGGDHGLVESGGVALVSVGEAMLLGDLNNLAWIKSEANSAFDVRAWERPWRKSVARIANELSWRRIGFEDSAMLVSTHRELAIELGPEHELIPIGSMATSLRARKDESELMTMQLAIDITDHAAIQIASELSAGLTESYISKRIDDLLRACGAEGPAFATTVASGPNAARPHHASSDRVIQENEPIVIDMGARVGGYCGDLTRTFWLGAPTPRFTAVYNAVERAHAAAMARVRTGTPLAQVDRAARDSLAEDGFGDYVIHSVGHGLGLEVHEAPAVSIAANGNLEIGHVVTIEPGLYVPGWGGVRVEDVVVVTADGHRILSGAPK